MSVPPSPDVFGRPFVVPELLTGLEPQFHPQTAEMERRIDAWTRPYLERMGFDEQAIAAFLARRQPWWLILIYPHGVPDRLVAMARLIQFMCAFDDLTDRLDAEEVSERTASLAKRLVSLSSSSSTPDLDPLTGMLADAWTSVTSDMTAGQMARLTAALKEFVEAELRGIEMADAGDIFRFEDYRRFRRFNVGTPVYVRVADFVLGLPFPEEFFTDPDVVEALALVSEHTAFVNDLLSFGKEIACGHWQTNALAVWHVAEGLDLQASVDQLAAHLRKLQQELALRSNRIREGRWAGLEGLESYLTELSLMVAGDVLFEFATSRYRGDGFVWDGITSGIATYHRSHFDIRKLPQAEQQDPLPARVL
ncbi:hypothetical protein ACFY2R_04365 [Micromonospora olivasterospora]|uniref:Terpene synthase n=1 Tax=Micromonospora olivasterospora TaxID=1880 RepID=A0A562IEH0_MICOL|nr:hypothetical protein [Micromonospora olivasterospora]TWH69208.1 hypothetical protein JD77_04216 [Micromonospora olivasterospora]